MHDEKRDDQGQQGRENAALEPALRSIEGCLSSGHPDLEEVQRFRQKLDQPARESFLATLRFFDHLHHYKGMRDGHPKGLTQAEWNALVAALAGALEPVLARKLGHLLDDLRRGAHSNPRGYAELRMPFGVFAFTKDSALENAKDRFERWLGKPAYRFPGKIPWGWPRFTLSVWESRHEFELLRLKTDDALSFGVALREDKLSPQVLRRLEQISGEL